MKPEMQENVTLEELDAFQNDDYVEEKAYTLDGKEVE